MPSLHLTLLPGSFAVCRLAPDTFLPNDLLDGPFVSLTRTADETSLILPEENATKIAAPARVETGWRLLKVAGPLDFNMTGVMAALAGPLAQAGISMLGIATFDTDYVLVREERLPEAVAALSAARHTIADTATP